MPLMEAYGKERIDKKEDDRVSYQKISENGRLIETHRNVKFTDNKGVEQSRVITETFANITKRKSSNQETNAAKRVRHNSGIMEEILEYISRGNDDMMSKVIFSK